MTPVEARNTSAGLHPAAVAASFAVKAVAARPVLPVNALALPELTTSARAFPPLSLARHHSTGAEGHFDFVRTPATVVSLSNNASSTSVRPLYLIPAAPVAMRTPAISGMSGMCLGARGETVEDMGWSFRDARAKARSRASAPRNGREPGIHNHKSN